MIQVEECGGGPPITTGATPERGGKLCRCHHCKREEICSPHNDFYTLSDWDDGPLFCDNCIVGVAVGKIEKPTKEAAK